MQKENVNGALRVLTNNMCGGILPLADETLQLLKLKHPYAKEASDRSNQVILQGPTQKIHPVNFHSINFINEEPIKSSHKNKRRFRTIRTRCMQGSKRLKLHHVLEQLFKKLYITNISIYLYIYMYI